MEESFPSGAITGSKVALMHVVWHTTNTATSRHVSQPESLEQDPPLDTEEVNRQLIRKVWTLFETLFRTNFLIKDIHRWD